MLDLTLRLSAEAAPGGRPILDVLGEPEELVIVEFADDLAFFENEPPPSLASGQPTARVRRWLVLPDGALRLHVTEGEWQALLANRRPSIVARARSLDRYRPPSSILEIATPFATQTQHGQIAVQQLDHVPEASAQPSDPQQGGSIPMDDLFRFILLRPAHPTPTPAVQLAASETLVAGLQAAKTAPDPLAARLTALNQERQSPRVVATVTALVYGSPMAALGEWLHTDPAPADDGAVTPPGHDKQAVHDKVVELTKKQPHALLAEPQFQNDITRLDDTLITLKLISDPGGSEVNQMVLARQGYEAVRLCDQRDVTVIAPPPLTIPNELRYQPVRSPVGAMPAPPQVAPQNPAAELEPQIANLDAALSEVIRLARTGVREDALAPDPPAIAAIQSRIALLEANAPVREDGNPAADVPAAGRRITIQAVGGSLQAPGWRLDPTSLSSVPREVMASIVEVVGDPAHVPIPSLSQRLTDARSELQLRQASLAFAQPNAVTKLGSSWYTHLPVSVASPLDNLPTSHGDLHPVGVGDLLMVREHVKAYEAGAVAHIENILRSEKLSRETRRLERTEQTLTISTERQLEEERDTQTTDRFSLKRETQDTIKTDAQIKAGLSVDAHYGPTVEVKADLQGSYQQQTEQSVKQATEFSRDVVTRSVSKLSEKTRTEQITKTLVEFEEKYGHGFDNTAGNNNISGVYQWVDRVSEAQVYNYGKRMLFDVMVPEPAAFYIWAEQQNVADSMKIPKPVDLTIIPSQLNEGNYLVWAQAYGATGIDPPPPLHTTIAQPWDGQGQGNDGLLTKSATLQIPDGYAAIQASAQAAWWYPTNQTPYVWVFTGDRTMKLTQNQTFASLSGEQASLPIGLFAAEVFDVVVSLEILCERTLRAWASWQEKAYAAIEQAYVAKLAEYQRAIAEVKAAQVGSVTGRNPGANNAVLTGELRKACIAELTAQQYDAFGALSSDAQGRPQLDLSRASQQGKYIRFFEQAFEWDHIVYFFYPYFWAGKDSWKQRSLFDDTDDPDFANFLRAGAARVVFATRRGFEKAILHFLDTGLIWDGGDPPDISSNLYLPIVNEIEEATAAPGAEVESGDPWEVRVPTSLVKLRRDDTLPTWKKVDGHWVPAN